MIDRINDRYGRCAIGFGLLLPDVRAFKGHAAFHRVPENRQFPRTSIYLYRLRRKPHFERPAPHAHDKARSR